MIKKSIAVMATVVLIALTSLEVVKVYNSINTLQETYRKYGMEITVTPHLVFANL